MLSLRLLIAFGTWVLIFFTFGAAQAGNYKEAAASVVTVVGMDSQDRPGLQGLGVVVGREGQVLTSAALLSANRGGVIKTATGNLQIIRALLQGDPLQDLAVVRIAAGDLPAVPLARAERLKLLEEVWVPVKEGNGFRLQEAQVTGILPLSPRLTLLKLKSQDPERPPGTPIFNGQGEVVGMLHSFPGSAGQSGSKFYLARHVAHLPLKEDRKDSEEGEEHSPENLPAGGVYLTFWEGVAASNRQDWKGAQEKFTAVLTSGESLPEACYGRGVARYHRRDFKGAVQDLEEACRRLPGYALAFLWLGKAWERLEDRGKAQGAYEKAVAAAPDLSEAWFRQGELAYQDGDLVKAKEYLERAADDFPQASARWWYLGNIAQSQNRPQEALEAFNRAIKLEPSFIRAYLEGGKVLLDLGRPKEAAGLLTQAVNLEPKNSPARYYLGLAHLMSWNRGGAWEQYFALQEINPEMAAGLAAALERTQ